MDRLTIEMELEKATKNKHRYLEDNKATGSPPMLGGLYIEKWATGPNPPARVRVTVEPLQ